MPTMNEWERKHNWKWKLALSVATFLFFLSFHVFNTDMHDFVRIAPGAAKAIGAFLFFASIGSLWVGEVFSNLGTKAGVLFNICWIALLLLACGVSTGFNMDYFNLR